MNAFDLLRLVCNKDPVPVSSTASPTTLLTSSVPSVMNKPVVKPVFAPRNNYDYDLLVHYSMLFYEAQRSGELEGNTRIRWRRNSHVKDGSNCGYDLSGGYYVSGGYVKYGFPTAYTMSMLALGFVEFQDSYDKADLTKYLKVL